MRSLLLLGFLSLAACGRDALNRDADGGSGGGTATGGGAGGSLGGGGGGATGGGGGSTCVGLSVDACRARTDCAADFCFQCTCTPQFKGCRASTAQPFDCPQLGCASPPCCQANAACQSPDQCAPPGTPTGCGACNNFPSTCASDSQCGATEICEPRHCACSGETDCVAGCSASNPCGTGTTCVNKRCQPSACSATARCPLTFDCISGACQRKNCLNDFDCGDGFCVTGTCHEAWGECRGPVP